MYFVRAKSSLASIFHQQFIFNFIIFNLVDMTSLAIYDTWDDFGTFWQTRMPNQSSKFPKPLLPNFGNARLLPHQHWRCSSVTRCHCPLIGSHINDLFGHFVVLMCTLSRLRNLAESLRGMRVLHMTWFPFVFVSDLTILPFLPWDYSLSTLGGNPIVFTPSIVGFTWIDFSNLYHLTCKSVE